jgi:RND superfamily putative drug exporter
VLGDANWWLPGWLDRRLPRISIEAPASAVRLPQPAAPGALLPEGLTAVVPAVELPVSEPTLR